MHNLCIAWVCLCVCVCLTLKLVYQEGQINLCIFFWFAQVVRLKLIRRITKGKLQTRQNFSLAQVLKVIGPEFMFQRSFNRWFGQVKKHLKVELRIRNFRGQVKVWNSLVGWSKCLMNYWIPHTTLTLKLRRCFSKFDKHCLNDGVGPIFNPPYDFC